MTESEALALVHHRSAWWAPLEWIRLPKTWALERCFAAGLLAHRGSYGRESWRLTGAGWRMVRAGP